MNNVRKDVRAKLILGLKEAQKKDKMRKTWHYETSKASNWITTDGNKYYFNSEGYDGKRYHSEECVK